MGVRGALLAAGGISASLFVADTASAQTQPPSPAPRAEQQGTPVDHTITVTGYRENALSSPVYTLPILDTPQTVTILSDQLLEEQGRRTLRDSLRNITGISLQAGEGSITGGDAFSVRGFSAREDVLVDGMRDTAVYFRDPFNSQMIEVTKGPGSAVAGRGNVGGTVNMVSRRPVLDNGGTIELTAGTDNLWRGTIDVNAILSQERGAAVRLNAMVNRNDVPGRDFTRNRHWGIAPAVAVGIDSDTTFSLAWFHLSQRDIPDYGIVNVRNASFAGSPFAGRPAPVRRSNNYGYTTDFWNIDVDMVTARLDHQFDDVFSVRSQARYSRTYNNSYVTAPLLLTTATTIDANTVEFGRVKARDEVHQLWISQTNLTAEFGPDSFRNTMVAGIELAALSQANRRQLDVDGPQTNLFNPVRQTIAPIPYQGTRARMDVDSVGAYLFDTIELGEQFRIVAGLRFDAIDTRVQSFDATGLFPQYVTDVSATDREWSYNAAFVWKPSRSSSVYLAYGTSFEPAGRVEVVLLSGRTNLPPVTAAALNADPERSDAWELGGRVELFDGRATLAAALFQIGRENARTPGANPTDPAVPFNGTQRVRGFELQLVGELTPGWNVLAGYSYLDGEILTSAVPAEIGQRLDNTPRHSFNVWTSYQVTDRLTLGGGVQHVGSRVSGRPVGFITVTVPAYTIADLFAEYRVTERIRARLNVFNITDEYYFLSFISNQSIPGPARSASLAVTFDF